MTLYPLLLARLQEGRRASVAQNWPFFIPFDLAHFAHHLFLAIRHGRCVRFLIDLAPGCKMHMMFHLTKC